MADPVKNMNVADIIQQAFDKKPVGVEDAFNSAIQDKMQAAIANRRAEIEAEMSGVQPSDDDDYQDVDADGQEEPDEDV